MERKHNELAHKLLQVCKGYKPIDVLDALGNLYYAFVETQLKEPTARILAYSEFVGHLNNKISEISEKILQNKH